MNKLSKFVKEKRLDLAMTQDDYAFMLKMSKPTLIKIEQGKCVGLQTLKKLNNYYGLSVRLLRRWMIVEDNES